MTASLRGVHLKGSQHNPSGQFACEPVCLESFELEPSTSYRQVGYGRCDGRCKLSLQVPKRRRQKWRSLELASATAALQQNALQHDCFAALGAQIRKSLRNHMMGWPADVRRFLAGAFAGAISKTATAPIESVRMQIMTGSKASVGELVRQTYERGGLLAFFSGNEADVLRTMPSKAIELASFDLYKKAFATLRPKSADGKQHPSGFGVTVAGALAGVTSTLAMFPLETVRTRLAVDHKTYRNVFTAFRLIFGQEGVPAFYRGLGASVLGVIPYSAIRLGSYDGLKWAYKKSTRQENVPPHVTMMFGAFAAIASSSASFPLEIVRRRAMMGTLPATGTLAALMTIARTEGVGALYAGVWLTWVKQAPQYAVTFLCYDLAKAWLAAENGEAREKRAAELRANAGSFSASVPKGLPAPQG